MKKLLAEIKHLEHKVALMQRGEKKETSNLLLHRYSRGLRVTDLTNAGKRGKEVDQFVLESEESDLFDQIEKAKDYAEALSIAKKTSDIKQLHQEKYRGIDVAPAGFKPILLEGKQVIINSDYDTFSVRDRSDVNEETCIPAIKGGKADIKVFYRWVSDNQDKIKNMTFNDIVDAMRSIGVKYHRYCALD